VSHAPNQVNQSLPVFGNLAGMRPRISSAGSPGPMENLELSLGHSSTGPCQPEHSETKKVTMLGLYAKKQYIRIIKRLETDEGTLWFDNLEQEIQDFQDI
jgi:hypothetical protein